MPNGLILETGASARAMAELLSGSGFTVSRATSASAAHADVASLAPGDVIILAAGDSEPTAVDLVAASKRRGVDCIVATETPELHTAVAAMRAGARDYIVMPPDPAHVASLLSEIKKKARPKSHDTVANGHVFGSLVGSSPAMRSAYRLIAKVAPTRATVLISGETGTGKELVARMVHQLSPRQQQRFLAINCGAVPASLIESELFGHEQGAFTGASRQRKGLFERAHNGTVFLDEVTEMPLELQVKLLRVLETGRIRRVGSEEEIGIDVRVVAATNRRPDKAVEDGKLRQDLYYRLSVFPIDLPPLRSRERDVVLLAQHFLDELNAEQNTSKSFSKTAVAEIEHYDWPGNVRELKNTVQRAYILADHTIELPKLSPELTRLQTTAEPDGPAVLKFPIGVTVADVERELIMATLEHHGGNKTKAAEVLGVSLKTLYNRLERFRQDNVAQAG